MPDKNKSGAPTGEAKLQFKQAILIAIITALATLVPSVLKIIIDARTITGLQNQVLNITRQKQTALAGTYSWDWATDDGWAVTGSVGITADGDASLTLDRWMMCGTRGSTRKKLLAKERGAPAPRFEPIPNSSDIRVFLPVEFNVYDNNCKVIGKDLQTIQGRITPVIAYSGRVNYASESRGTYQGNMVLVRTLEGTP
jgi:hypothetical protein